MADITRTIGLSLGADLCWPICYEEIVRRLQVSVPQGGDRVSLDVERVTIEPFDLRQGNKYSLVIDRLTHWYHTSREWIKKSVIMDDLYVLNNPWTLQSMEKCTTYAAMMRLGMPVPDTWLLPPKSYEPSPDLKSTLERYAKLFDLGQLGQELGYPLFMKPYDGGAWVAVDRIEDEAKLRETYEASGKRVMHLQAAVLPFDLFVRCVGVGPQVRIVKYDPSAPLHDRYQMDRDVVNAEDARLLEDMTLTINSFFGWDFNSCEALRKDGVYHPIDFANACPDSQVTSLHYHFPWLLESMVRWTVFCTVTGRPMHRNVDWQAFYDAHDPELPLREQVAAYGKIARARFDVERFEEFSAEHLGHLGEVVDDFFSSDVARQAVQAKVAALYPEHEVEPFTDLFWQRIQDWRCEEGHSAAISSSGDE